MAYAERAVNRAFFAWLVRAALLLLALQLGGVIHTAADALGAVGVLAAEHEQCPADGACDDCLAGCPNCHCAGALRTVVPESGLVLELDHGGADVALRSTGGAPAPLGPTLPSLYRPPRGFARIVTV